VGPGEERDPDLERAERVREHEPHELAGVEVEVRIAGERGRAAGDAEPEGPRVDDVRAGDDDAGAEQGEEGPAEVLEVEPDQLLRSRRGGEEQQPEPGRQRAPGCESLPRRPASLRHASPHRGAGRRCSNTASAATTGRQAGSTGQRDASSRTGGRREPIGCRTPRRGRVGAAPVAVAPPPRQRRRTLPSPASPRPRSTTVVGSGTTSTFIATVSRPQPALVTWIPNVYSPRAYGSKLP